VHKVEKQPNIHVKNALQITWGKGDASKDGCFCIKPSVALRLMEVNHLEVWPCEIYSSFIP